MKLTSGQAIFIGFIGWGMLNWYLGYLVGKGEEQLIAWFNKIIRRLFKA